MRQTTLLETGYGARISGFRAADINVAAMRFDWNNALWRAGLLHIPQAHLSPDQFVSLAAHFGVLERVYPKQHRWPRHPCIRRQSNIAGLGVNGGGMYWHSDGPWNDPPTSVTLLQCIEAPESGGETSFADMRTALRELDETAAKELSNRNGWFPCRMVYRQELKQSGRKDTSKLRRLRDVHRPLICVRPQTGVRALYLNEAALHSVEGLDPLRSSLLLRHLYHHCTGKRFIYRHRWEDGDVLIWDNYSTMHKAFPAVAGTRKITQRITVQA